MLHLVLMLINIIKCTATWYASPDPSKISLLLKIHLYFYLGLQKKSQHTIKPFHAIISLSDVHLCAVMLSNPIIHDSLL